MKHNLFKKLIFVGIWVLASMVQIVAVEKGKHVISTDKWIKDHFAKGKIPPFSFMYDGASSNTFLDKWKYSASSTCHNSDSVIKYTFVYKQDVSGMEVVCNVTAYPFFDAVEWVLLFLNNSVENSGNITDVKVIDYTFCSSEKGDVALHYSEGNHISREDFHPHSKLLHLGDTMKMQSMGGRSSQGDFLPFFNVEMPDNKGAVVAVGWTGNWYVCIDNVTLKSMHLSSGMQVMDLFLYPSESIRTPSICLMFWQDKDRIIGHNKFRKFLLSQVCRQINGSYAMYPFSSGFNYHDPAPCTEYSCITTDYAIAMVRRYKQFDLFPDMFWLDAGWHTGASDYQHGKSWANTTGNWTVDSLRFPNGLGEIADEIHDKGAKFMVWFEPERVIRGTEWATRYPGWMLDIPESKPETYLLFDLGNDDARNWLCATIGDLIAENRIDYYRQDFNMEPDIYWTANDEPGRKGMKEIRHIEGLYSFWDYLLQRFPDMLIDNCASGGRRLDWETTKRSAPLWRSDYYHYNDPEGYQGHTYGLNFFLPIHGTGILQTDPYAFRSSLSSTLIQNWKITESGSLDEMRRCAREYRELQPYYYKDYYPLTGIDDTTSDSIWLAYQMHDAEADKGIIVAFRHQKCTVDSVMVKLGGLVPDKKYRLVNRDNQKVIILDGATLLKGFFLVAYKPQTSIIWQYEIIK